MKNSGGVCLVVESQQQHARLLTMADSPRLAATHAETIEAYLARADPYRVAYPGDPQTLPLDMTSVADKDFIYSYNSLHGNIQHILSSRNIDCLSFSASQCKKITLLVVISAQTHEALPTAARDIYGLFETQGESNLQVELRDPQRWAYKITSATAPSSEDIQSYEAVKFALRETIDADLGDLCYGFSLYMRGRHAGGGELKPTVVVLVRPTSTHDWAMVKANLKRVMRDGGCGVELELLPGCVGPTACDDPKEGGLDQLQFGLESEKPQNGASIGIVGDSRRTGTLGGFLYLKVPSDDSGPEKTYLCALTNHHVVEPLELDLAAQVHDSGTAISSDRKFKAEVQYPSALDLQATIANYQEMIHNATIELQKCTQKEAEGIKVADKMFKRQEAVRTQCRLALAVCEKLKGDPTLGQVLASSGLSGCPPSTSNVVLKAQGEPEFSATCGDPKSHQEHYKRDWALIQVLEDKFNVNKAPPACMVHTRAGVHYVDDDSAVVDSVASVEPGMWITLRGRTSGVVCGQVGTTKWEGRWSKDYGSGTKSDTRTFWSSEWQIMPLRGRDRKGAAGGDSGSWLWSEHKEPVGSLHGEDYGHQLNMGLFTEMKCVFEDIEKKTRGRVYLIL